ncbi:MAG: hypothetical protein DME75_03965, partial [Verrucomicrobia bacterium]
MSVFNGATCNAASQSNCATAASFSLALFPSLPPVVDETTHTVYVPQAGTGALDFVAMINGSTCNGTVTSGCRNTPPLVQVGDDVAQVVVDPTTSTVYVISEESTKI